MPKNPLKTFGRRKSSSNILDAHLTADEPQPAQDSDTTFRVLERPPKNVTQPVDGPKGTHISPRRPFTSTLSHLRLGKSADDINAFTNRGSAGTTHSGSSYHYDSSSARHSSFSTLPSSVDPERDPDDEELFPRKTKAQPMNKPSLDAPLPPPPSFTTRATRAFSFGSRSSRNEQSSRNESERIPPVPPIQYNQRAAYTHEDTASRDRAETVSSYASTAIPNVPERSSASLQLNRVSTGFGDDFGKIFSTIGKETPRVERQISDLFPVVDHRTESEPAIPAPAFSRTGRTPSPNPALIRRQTDSPYSFEAQDSDQLMPGSASQSPALGSAPTPPIHNSTLAQTFLGSKPAYAPIPEHYSPGIDTPLDSPTSNPEAGFALRQKPSDDGLRWARKVMALGEQSTAERSRTSIKTPNNDSESLGVASSNATPRAVRSTTAAETEDSLFDLPASSSRRAVQSVLFPRTTSQPQKRMTTAEFERLRSGKAVREQASDDEGAADEDYDDQDDAERAREVTRQRRKQEANMAVYRQQMKKVTGGGPADLPTARPSYDRAPSTASTSIGIHLGGLSGTPPPDAVRGKAGNDGDDDVPLGILQAHGFPSASRPPNRPEETDAYGQRRASVAGSAYGGGGGAGRPLPPFARKLPADPYFGAGIVNQSNRESLAFASNTNVPTHSAPTPPPMTGHPGGLVGVIAGEERARAARRGSPNPTTGTYDQPMPLPSNMLGPSQNMPRAMSMTNSGLQVPFAPGQIAGMPMMPGTPSMPPMFGMPGMQQMPMNLPQDQMQQFMQMQMQLMQNMLAIQQQTLGQPSQVPVPTQEFLGVPGTTQRPMSSMSSYGRPVSQALPSFDMSTSQRPASSMGAGYTPSVFGMNVGGPGPGYTPSIAPSERSNVGMPSRYRPVSMMPSDDQHGRTQSMTSNVTLQAFNNRSSMNLLSTPDTNGQSQGSRPVSTIRVIDKPKGVPASRQPARPAANGDNSDEEESGWAEMAKKRTEKKWSWRRKNENPKQKEQAALQELYQGLDE